ncbi:hypothetical protein BV25DRAFT_1879414 [Artomyces pyxidatus]|uniref:Uncharacterized protein n=1 Tax=Artomyces pyxidatus TaxID=48021 RepID=A0ACB8TDA6_9AGAM|nr:hypothetical protein BV25DRAFT_1879414 [Artomyces pyxidatus]
MSDMIGVNGTICTADELANSVLHNTSSTLSCLTRGQTVGLTLTAESAFISEVSVVILFCLIAVCRLVYFDVMTLHSVCAQRNAYRYWRTLPRGSWRLLQTPTDIYMLFLFVCDIIQALGGMLDVKWAHTGKVHTGSFCTAQGVIQQLGEVGVALATLAISVHTFVVVFWRIGIHSRPIAYSAVGLICLFDVLFVSIGAGVHRHQNYEEPTPYWCWIGHQYEGERLAGEYLWFWVTLFFSLLAYVPLYFWSRGNLSVDQNTWWRFHIHRRAAVQDFDGQGWRALSMLAYPVIYCILVIPLSIARWRGFSGHTVPSSATFFSIVLYNLSGFCNVVLLLTTRPQLLLFAPPVIAKPTAPELRETGEGWDLPPVSKDHLRTDVGNAGEWDLPSSSRNESRVSVGDVSTNA